MIRKLAASFALLVGLVALAGPTAPASAGGPSGYRDCVITAVPQDLDAGEQVQVSGDDLMPNLTTDVIFDVGEPDEEVLGSVTTDPFGHFGPDPFTIPADASDGTHTISAACDGTDGSVLGTSVQVGGAALPTGDGGDPLPTTGSDVEPLVVAGAAALLAGTAFVLIAKRRRSAAT